MEEAMQKTRNESCLLNDRLEAESIEGAQTGSPAKVCVSV